MNGNDKEYLANVVAHFQEEVLNSINKQRDILCGCIHNPSLMITQHHNHYGFTVWMAGGGIRGGTVYGATDEFGFKAVEKPTSVHDLHATILHLLGFDHEKLTYRYAGRDFRLTDVHGNVIRDILT